MTMKLPDLSGKVIVIKSDQEEARKCCENSLKTKRGVFMVLEQTPVSDTPMEVEPLEEATLVESTPVEASQAEAMPKEDAPMEETSEEATLEAPDGATPIEVLEYMALNERGVNCLRNIFVNF